MKILVENEGRKYRCELVSACDNIEDGIVGIQSFDEVIDDFKESFYYEQGYGLTFIEGELLFSNDQKYPKTKGVYKFDYACTITNCKCDNKTINLEKQFQDYLFFDGKDAYSITDRVS